MGDASAEDKGQVYIHFSESLHSSYVTYDPNSTSMLVIYQAVLLMTRIQASNQLLSHTTI